MAQVQPMRIKFTRGQDVLLIEKWYQSVPHSWDGWYYKWSQKLEWNSNREIISLPKETQHTQTPLLKSPQVRQKCCLVDYAPGDLTCSKFSCNFWVCGDEFTCLFTTPNIHIFLNEWISYVAFMYCIYK